MIRRIVLKIPIKYCPPPTDIPTPTVAQMPAAVVSPLTLWLCTKIIPAPRKPMAVTTPAAILDGSSPTLWTARMSLNPYLEMIIISAAANDTIT